jgi:hypothetical protein
MKMLLQVRIPHKEFNEAVKDGSAGKKMRKIFQDSNAQSVFMTEFNGQRGALMIVDMNNESQIPALAEPWFLQFNADVEFHVVMSLDDLERAGLEDLGKKWK